MKSISLVLLITSNCLVWGYEWNPLNYEQSLKISETCKDRYREAQYNKIAFMDPLPEVNKYIFECLLYDCGLFSIRRGWNLDRLHSQFKLWSKYGEGFRHYSSEHVNYCIRHDNPKETWYKRAYKMYECCRINIDRYKMERDAAETKRILDARRRRIWQGINNGLHAEPFWFNSEEEVKEAIYNFTQLEMREKNVHPIESQPTEKSLDYMNDEGNINDAGGEDEAEQNTEPANDEPTEAIDELSTTEQN